MSNRIDRSLGVKPYSNHGGMAAPQPKGFSLKLKTVLVWLALIVAGAALYPTTNCVEGVRCAD
ncbi:hypothetical protein HYP93_gp06 [Stenotrophomonas phage Pokken]|uniref:Uncharacterized protein n=1 Tax=Stenotrophomonas phage Pokken TaxID=2596674 RepID=A0A5B9N6R4_9CAUD|nr:hypothetical protein HYP93_gp06 [Stenotrophomonas phage Pokken]QEG09229.1 hypothetical protein CPT_Pokken_006 [Stenotrophomonas phage Pokken]